MPSPSPTLLTTGAGGATGTPSTASITPTSNRLVLAIFTLRADAAAGVDQITVSGCGLTWVRMDEQDFDAGGNRVGGVWRALGASPSSGAVTFTYGGAGTPIGSTWIVSEFDNVDTSGTNGSGAVGTLTANVGTSPPDSGGGTSSGATGQDISCAILHTLDNTTNVVGPSGFANIAHLADIETQTWLDYDVDQLSSFTYTWDSIPSSRTWATQGFVIKAASGATRAYLFHQPKTLLFID